MNSKMIFFTIFILLAACSPAPIAAPTAQMEPTPSPDPTATPTELAPTELPPSPTATIAPSETPTEAQTEALPQLVFNFELSETNPALEKGASGEWDNFRAYESSVIFADDVYHMFYTGISADFMAIGYAFSSDGISFTKHNANPIFQADGTGFDAAGIGSAVPLVVGDTWMLYYNGRPEGASFIPWHGGPSIGLTTAPAPAGPWGEGQQVLSAGSDGEWDSGIIVPTSVFLTEDGYRMYYFGRQISSEQENTMCGMATSQDGIQWTKYDDPETTEPPFAESDPIFHHPNTGQNVECFVLKTDSGWEMFYEAYPPYYKIFYNTIIDGIHWPPMKPTNPILSEGAYPRVIKVDSNYYLYAMNDDGREIYLSIGTIEQP